MRRSSLYFVLLAVAGFLAIQLLTFSRSAEDSIPEPSFHDDFLGHYGIFALPTPNSLHFAGEPVPMGEWEVRERYDRELLVNTYWQSSTLLVFKRAHRWFPVIEPILEAHGVPNDFKYLAVIESSLMNAISPAGATGFWQILQGTARELGLEVNTHIDERYHVEKATAAACQYLLNAKDRFGSWTLAAAAYNIGNARLSRIMDSQQADCYYDLFLNEETARYMFRLLAVKTIMSDPESSGFHFRKEDLYPSISYRIVPVSQTINDLVEFASNHGTTYKILREMNPWIRGYELPNRSGKMYEIKIPE